MFDRELTAAEIANIYNTKIITGPSALYRFNGNADDETGNYNGTATNLSFSGAKFHTPRYRAMEHISCRSVAINQVMNKPSD